MNLVNLKLGEAQYFIEQNHRHSDPLKRHKFSIGVCNDDYNELYGVLTVDVPSGRWKNPRDKIEIRRVCTLPNQKNVASFLIGKAVTACFAMGYKEILTYTRPHESGSTLKACGFSLKHASKIKVVDGTEVTGLLCWYKKSKTQQTSRNTYKYLDHLKEFLKQNLKGDKYDISNGSR